MLDEIKSIEKIDTWELVDLPKGYDLTGIEWVYKTKLNAEENIE